jgi:hypothetical protein
MDVCIYSRKAKISDMIGEYLQNKRKNQNVRKRIRAGNRKKKCQIYFQRGEVLGRVRGRK